MGNLRCAQPVLMGHFSNLSMIALHLLLVISLTLAYEPSDCGVWLAPSTIPGAGMGMFAGQWIDADSPIGPPEIGIVVVDYFHHRPESDEYLLDFYSWTIPSMNHANKEGVDYSTIFIPGGGAAINCILSLTNTVGMDNWIEYSTEGLHRSKDPGIGAFTPFYNRQLYSRVEIEPGAELFDWYGEDYFKSRPDLYGMIPLREEHYETADGLLQHYLEIKEKIGEEAVHEDWYQLIHGLTEVWPSRALNALPDEVSEVEDIAARGTAYKHDRRSHRSLEWLAEYGQCMDLLETKRSEIEQAGKGAFARVSIQKGQVLGPAPVMHKHRSFFDMYPFEINPFNKIVVNRTAEIVHKQLLLNYCYGSADSSVLLCPYGSVLSTVNHNPAKANAKIEWNLNMMQHPEWLEILPSEWVWEKHAGLIMNFVATKDIAAGDEIFISYGDDWQRAWDEHVAHWKPPPDAKSYRSAVMMNEAETIIRTVAEGHYDETNTELNCRNWYRLDQGHPDFEELYVDAYLCRAVDRHEVNGEMLYTVELYEKVADEQESYVDVYEVLFDVPRDAFKFEDRPYTRDHAQFWSFRHELGLPEDMLPDVWRDLQV